MANRHRAYVLAVLTLVYTFNYVDRQILVILAEPIKAEFGLADWQLGFLTGTAFALFYATLGIPIAALADRRNRVSIIAISLAVWSAMTVMCGWATSFVQLTAARIGVGVGEAGGNPPAVSVLADYFDEGERATGMGVYSLGPTAGISIGFVVGGWINQWYGWRAAMLAVGIPGLLLAIVMWLTIREPQRRAPVAAKAPPTMAVTVRTLYANHVCRWVNVAAVAAGFAVYGVMVWTPVYFIRRFGLSTGEVGTAIGVIAGIAGSAGVLGGGFLADRLASLNPRWVSWMPALTTLLFAPCVLLMLSASSAALAFALLVPVYVFALAYTGPTWAMLQTAAPAHMRAMAAAVLLLLVNLVGLGLGPQVIGILSDVLGRGGGTDGLRTAIAAAALVGPLAALSFYRAASGITEPFSGIIATAASREDRGPLRAQTSNPDGGPPPVTHHASTQQQTTPHQSR